MPDLIPSSTERIVTSEAPQSRLSSGDIAQPYEVLSRGLDKLGEGLEKVAEPLAERAGYQSVSMDNQGNLQVSHAPIFGEAGAAYARARKFSALAQGEAAARRQDLEISQKFPNDPQGYLAAAGKFKDKLVNEYSKVSPEVGIALGRSIDNQTTYNYRYMLLQQQRTIRDNFDSDTKAAIKSRMDDIDGILNSGGGNTPEGKKEVSRKFREIEHLTHERVNNPILNAPAEEEHYNLKKMDERIGAGQFVGEVNNILKKQGIGKASDYVEGVLNNPDLSPSQRAINYAHGIAAVKEYQQGLERDANVANKVQKMRDDIFENQVIEGTDGRASPISEHEIKNAPNISPEAKMRMLAWKRRDGLPEPMAQVSQAAAMDLFRRMNLPDGDPQKITDLSSIREAYAPVDGSKGKLTRADEEWLEKRFVEGRSPEGTRLDQVRQQFTKAVEPSIDKSNPLLGKLDESGKLQAYQFHRFVDDKIEEYRKAGKNPMDLFNPGKSDYLGKPDVLEQFKVPLSQSIQNIRKNLGGQVVPSPAPSSPPATRQPGESVQQFLNRTGG